MEGRMNKTQSLVPAGFPNLLKEIKARIQQHKPRRTFGQRRIGPSLLGHRPNDSSAAGAEGWGAAVIPRLASELRSELAEIKGFSERNIGRMIAYYREYPNPAEFLPQVAAKLSAPDNLPQAAAKMDVPEKCRKLGICPLHPLVDSVVSPRHAY